MKKFGSKGEVKLRFRLMTKSAGLLGDKVRCGICKDGKCELCDKGVVDVLCISCCTVESSLVVEEDFGYD